MPEGFELGKAFLTVDPDAADFKTKLKTVLQKDKTEVKVKVVPDSTDFKKRMEADLAKNRSSGIKVKVEPDAKYFSTKLNAALAKDRDKHIKVTVDYDKSKFNKLMSSAGSSGGAAFSKGFSGALKSAGGAVGGGGGAGGAGGGIGGPALGVGIGALLVASLASLPALMSGAGVVGGVALAGGLVLALNKKNPQVKSALKEMTNSLKNVLSPMLGPVLDGMQQLSKFVKDTLAPQLSQTFKILAPDILPVLKGIEALVTDLLPGLNKMLAATSPFLKDIAGWFSSLGKTFSDFFTALIPGLTGSYTAFGGILTMLERFVVTVGQIASTLASGAGKSIAQFFMSFGNLFDKLLTTLAPTLNLLVNALLPILSKLMDSVSSILPILGKLVDVILSVINAALQPMFHAIEMLLPMIVQLVNHIGGSLITVIKMLTPELAQAGKMFVLLAMSILPPLIKGIESILPPITNLIVTLVKSLIPAFNEMLPSISKVIIAIQPLINNLIHIAVIIIENVVQALTDVVKFLAPVILWLSKVDAAVYSTMARFLDWASKLKDWSQLWDLISSHVSKVWDDIYTNVNNFISNITKNITNWFNDLVRLFSTAWDTIYRDINSAWSRIANFFSNFWHLEVTGWDKFGHDVWNTLHSGWLSMENDIHAVWSRIMNWVTSNLINPLKTAFRELVSALGSIWSGIEHALAGPVNWVIKNVYDPIAKVIDKVTSFIGLGSPLPQFSQGGIIPDALGTGGGGIGVPRFGGGGLIPGYAPGLDIIPAVLSPGEAVLTPGAARALGHTTINRLNAAHRPNTPDERSMGHFGWGLNPISDIKQAASDVKGFGEHLLLGGLTDVIKPILEGILHSMPSLGAGAWGKSIKQVPVALVNDLIHWLQTEDASKPTSSAVGFGSGSQVAQYAKQYATGHGHPYVLGGASPNTGWDCSGFSAWVYEHFGYLPGKQGTRFGTSESQFADTAHLQPSSSQPGSLVFFDDHFFAPPGHVGVVLNNSSYVSAYDTSEGTVIKPITSPMGFRIPKGGFNTLGGQGSNGVPSNLITVGKFLMGRGYNRAAAAGAAGVVGGEAVPPGNPESVGSGGYGLIGWTPPFSRAEMVAGAVPSPPTGNAAVDMQSQLLAMVNWMALNGWGPNVANKFNSPLQAALSASATYERPAVRGSDVHPSLVDGVYQALSTGGTANPGWAWVGEKGPELVHMSGGEVVLDASTSAEVAPSGLGGFAAYASGSLTPKQKAALAKAQARARAARIRAEARAKTRAASTLRTEQGTGTGIIDSLATSMSGGSIISSSSLNSDISRALNAIAKYYSGARAKDMETILTRQSDVLKGVLVQNTTLTARIAAGTSYANNVTQNLSGYAGLSGLTNNAGNQIVPTTGSGVGLASSIYVTLRQKLQALQLFSKLIKEARGKHVNTSFLEQAIALGPDGGTQYLQAILSGGSSIIKEINSTMSTIGKVTRNIGYNAADLIYDPASIGKGLLTGLKSQRAALDKEMQNLGHMIAITLAKDLRVPLSKIPHFASGGSFAAGTMALVGENGPELVRFQQPGTVYPNGMTPPGAGGAGTNINVYVSGSTADPEVIAQAVYSKQMLLVHRNAVPPTTRTM